MMAIVQPALMMAFIADFVENWRFGKRLGLSIRDAGPTGSCIHVIINCTSRRGEYLQLHGEKEKCIR